MIESMRAPGKGRIRKCIENCPKEHRKMVESGSVSENDKIWASTGKRYNPCEYGKTVPAITKKESNQCDYRKIKKSRRVPGKGRINSSIEKLS